MKYSLCILLGCLIVLVQNVEGENYGKVTCMGKNPTPSAKLLGTFIKAKCNIPTKFTDEALGKVTRCVFKYTKSYVGSKFNKDVAMKVFPGAFPKKDKATLEALLPDCLNVKGAKAKNEKDDPSGASWAPLYHCFQDFFDTKACKT